MKPTLFLLRKIVQNLLLGSFILLLINPVSAQDPLYYTNTNLPCIQRTFHPHVFIVRDSFTNPIISNQELTTYFEKLNQAFAPICIDFKPCQIDFLDDYSFESITDDKEIESLVSRKQKKRRINIYFTGSVFDEEINSFSTFNGIRDTLGATLIVPKTGRGLIHEMGHTFGLLHVFETEFGLEKADQSNCATAGDLICDTPAMPEIKIKNNICAYESDQKDPVGAYYKPEIGNYMTHYFCAHCFFSREQYIRMAENYLSSPFNMW